MVLLVILALLLMTVIAAWAILNHYLNKIPKIDEETPLPPDALTDVTDYIGPENTDLPIWETVDWDWEPETDPPVTNPPETKAPETDPSETKAPETDPSETKAPETDPPETKAPETDPPETKAPETDPPETKAPETKAPETLPEETNNPGRVKVSEKELINFLLVGQDTRVPGVRTNTDTMILCSINIKTREITLVSFLRDLYVQMPTGYQDNRLNVAYIYGGFPFLYEVIEKNFGITVDGGFEIDFSGFENIINLIGGVDINILEREVAAMPETHPGMNHLDGRLALNYVRLREIDSDFSRTQRQRQLLTSVFNSLKGASLSKLNEIANTALPYVRTDLSNTEITGYLLKILPILSEFKLYSFRVPVDGAYYGANVRGMIVLVPNLKKNQEALKEFLSVY